MDPVSVAGLTASLLGTVNIIAKSVGFLASLQSKYRQADLTVSLLIGQLSTLQSALNQISEWVTVSLVAVSRYEQLVSDLTISVEGCRVLLLRLDDRITSFKRNKANTLVFRDKARLLWAENDTSLYLSLLNNQITALNLLLTALQCRSIFEQKNLLQSDESRHIVDIVKDDISSLLMIGDPDSCRTSRSIMFDNSNMLDKRFDFDRQIFGCRVYQAALRSNMSQLLIGKGDQRTLHREQHLDTSLGTTSSTSYKRLNDSKEDLQAIKIEKADFRPTEDETLNSWPLVDAISYAIVGTSSNVGFGTPNNRTSSPVSCYHSGLAGHDGRNGGPTVANPLVQKSTADAIKTIRANDNESLFIGTTEYPYWADALYGYRANPDDPNEISFSAHETLRIRISMVEGQKNDW